MLCANPTGPTRCYVPCVWRKRLNVMLLCVCFVIKTAIVFTHSLRLHPAITFPSSMLCLVPLHLQGYKVSINHPYLGSEPLYIFCSPIEFNTLFIL